MEKEKSLYTFGMIKPDGMEHKEEILKMILEKDLRIVYWKIENLTEEEIEENYKHIKNRDFYPEMKKNLLSGPVLKLLIHDPDANAVEKYREVLGSTKSCEAAPDTIRGKFGNKEVSFKNAAHGSGNLKEAKEEVIRFFKEDLFDLFNNISFLTLSDLTLSFAKDDVDEAIKYVDNEVLNCILDDCKKYNKKD